MSWDDFDLFCQVVEHGGFTAAANALQRPKSSLSAAVARLERQLGVRLLERTTRRLRLTDAGRELHRDIEAPFRHLRDVARDTQARGERVHGTLHITSPYEFGAHYLSAPIGRLLEHHPELQIELDVDHSRINLFDRQVDVVFSMTEHSDLSPGTVARRVFTIPRGLFAAPELVIRQPPLRSLADLADWPLLPTPAEQIWHFTSPDGVPASLPLQQVRLRSANAETRLHAALGGHGVARTTASFCAPLVKQGRLQALLPEWQSTPLRIFALLPANRLMPAKVRALLQELTHQEMSMLNPG
ncbi:MAG: LysR family transcriptional regulator [Pigmentiphaga sp.]